MRGSYLPRPTDHFPSLRRGHGRGLGKRRPAPTYPKGYKTSKLDCVAPGCAVESVHASPDALARHHDAYSNFKDWLDERGLKVAPWA